MTGDFNIYNLFDERNLELRVGDKYRLRRMNGDDAEAELQLTSWDFAGMVHFKVMYDSVRTPRHPGSKVMVDLIHQSRGSVPIDRIAWLILNRVWIPIDDPATTPTADDTTDEEI